MKNWVKESIRFDFSKLKGVDMFFSYYGYSGIGWLFKIIYFIENLKRLMGGLLVYK